MSGASIISFPFITIGRVLCIPIYSSTRVAEFAYFSMACLAAKLLIMNNREKILLIIILCTWYTYYLNKFNGRALEKVRPARDIIHSTDINSPALGGRMMRPRCAACMSGMVTTLA